jgi:hypothetical protein
MDKNTKAAIKQLLQSGALSLLEQVATEVKSTFETPEFRESSDQLLYDTGKYVGQQEGLEMFFEYITSIAQDV